MIKVCFLSWHYASPEIFLNSIIKMTPGCSGKWKDMEAVIDPFQADFCIVIDGYNKPFPKERAIYVGEHPDCCKTSFRTWDKEEALSKLSLDKYLNPGEWWIKYEYDYLVRLKPVPKSKKLVCVCTYQTHNPMYEQRAIFLEHFVQHTPDVAVWFSLFGRPEEKYRGNPNFKWVYGGPLGVNKPDGTIGEHLVGKEIIQDYTHALEFDVGPTKNYFSERFYDALLLWTMPIYFGSNNVHEYIPKEAFEYVNIHDLNDSKKIANIVSSPVNLEKMAEARDLLLNKYQLWPYVYNIIKNL